MINEFRNPESQFPSLARREAHIWKICLRTEPEEISRLFETLSAEEQARAKRFVFERDAHRYTVSHAALRYLLGNYTSLSRKDIQIFFGQMGKPYIQMVNKSPALHFNLSHSGELAVMAFSREGELGIDIEQKRPDAATMDIAERNFSARELEELKRIPEADRVAGFFRCWTRKEAYVKAKGVGLGYDLQSFDVSVTRDDLAELRAEDASMWKIFAFQSDLDYWGALVYPNSVQSLSLWSLTTAAIL